MPTAHSVRWPLCRAYFALLTLGAAAVALFLRSGATDVLQRKSGDSLAVIVTTAPPVLAGLAAVGFVGLLVAVVWQKPANRGLEWFARWLAPPGDDTVDARPAARGFRVSLWLGIVVVVVLLTDGLSIPFGYFESDDFDLLVANRVLPFPEQLVTTHNDHSLPLLRLEVLLMEKCFGSQAVFYNVAVLISFAALLTAGGLLLFEMGASRLTALLFLSLCVGWTLWSDFTTGEYILQKYMQITTAGLLAVRAALRWNRTGHRRDAVCAASCVAFAGLMNVSGFWVPCAWLAASFLDYWGITSTPHPREWFSRTRVPLGLVAFAVAVSLGVHAYVYSRPTNAGLLSSPHDPATLYSVSEQIVYMLGTLLLSIVVPIPHHLGDFGLLTPAVVAALLIGFVFVVTTSRRMDRQSRYRLFVLLTVLGGVLGMVSLGRPARGMTYVVPAKYQGPAFVWLCLLMAWCWQFGGEGVARRHRPLYLKVTILLILTSWLAHQTASLLGACGTPFFEVTRGGKLREHIRERAALAELRQLIFVPLEASGLAKMTVPDIPGRALGAQYPALAFTWGEVRPLSTFIDVLAERPEAVRVVQAAYSPGLPPRGVEKVEDLRAEVSPKFLEVLRGSTSLQELIETPYSIECKPGPFPAEERVEPAVEDRGDWTTSEFAEEWFPERGSILQFVVEPTEAETIPDLPVSIRFRPAWTTRHVEHPVSCPEAGQQQIEIDLRQSLAFALSERITELSIRWKGEGAVHVVGMEVSRGESER